MKYLWTHAFEKLDLWKVWFYEILHNNNVNKDLTTYIQSDSLPDQQTLRGDGGHEDQHY